MSDFTEQFGVTLPAEDPVFIFGLILVLVLISPVIAKRLRLPDIVGLIAAGIIVGPYGLELLARDQTIELLGQVGLLYIMFQAGLEIDLDQVNKQRSHTLSFGLITFAVPLTLGIVLGMNVYGMSFAVAALFASMFSSHTLVTFPVVTRLGISRARSVTSSVGATIITDILALLVLAIVAATAEGELSAVFWIQLFSLMAIYTIAVLFLTPRLGRYVLKSGAFNDNSQFIFVIAIVFVAGWLAHVAGLEPIIGAFLVGLCLNRIVPERSLLMTRIHFTGDAIFIPFFLLSVGMLVDLRLLLGDTETWAVAGGMVAVALGSKALAAWLSGAILGYDYQERSLMYGLSVNQAAATLAAVLVGYELGLFGEAVVTGTIIMIAVTCFVGPVVTERAGRAVALAQRRKEHTRRNTPDRILLAVDSREHARVLFDLALLFRHESSHEPLYPVSVARDGTDVEETLAENERLLAHVVARGIASETPVLPVTNLDTNIAGGVIRAARENRAPVISAYWDGSSHGRSRTFGSVLDEIIDQSERTVVISRLVHPISTSKRLVCIIPPFCERESGFDVAVSMIRQLASRSGSKLIIWATEDTIRNSDHLLDARTDAKTDIEVHTFSVLRQFLEEANAQFRTDDWVLMIQARKGGVSWHPTIQKAPTLLVHALPGHNISFLYPPTGEMARTAGVSDEDETLDTDDIEEDVTTSQKSEPALKRRHCVRGARVSRIEELLSKMIDAVSWDSRDARKRVLDTLCDIAHEEAIQLEDGIVLLHAHLDEVSERVVLAGSTRERISVRGISSDVRAVIALLNPIDLDPQLHLEMLGRIVQEVRSPETRRRLGIDD